ncbi:MAG: hypothetical protein WBE58_06555 [Verrucomicrobiales bacterium]
MNATHLHLLLNHVPVLGTVFGLVLLTFGMWRKSRDLQKAALGVFVIVACLGVPAYLTGEPAEDGVENLPGVSEVFIEQHESAASFAFTGIVALGVIGLFGLFLFRHGKPVSTSFAVLMLMGSLSVSVLMAWTANLGGQIRHTEIRPNAATPAVEQRKERD